MADVKTDKTREKSFPPSEITDKSGQITVLRHKWKRAKHEYCSEDKCYYPLKKFKHDANAHEAKIVDKGDKGQFHEAVCSWDPLHGSGELVPYPGTKDGVARIQYIKVPDPVKDEE
jgi:hypothetical protein